MNRTMSVNEKLKDHLHDQLFKAVLELKDINECYEFFEDICTIQEMKAIAARLEVARMLKAGDIYEDIVKKTGASTATISRIKRCLMYGSGGYAKILDRMAEKNPDFLKLSPKKGK
ncbi:Trp operon repressor family [Megasphaera cerevisiae DSM 20462]|nr:Trp operon repressor family [Megasphaera cerevisiae DSM 20462]